MSSEPAAEHSPILAPAGDDSIPQEFATGQFARNIRICDDTKESISLYYDTFGNPSDPCVLFICGLGAQMIDWDDELLSGLAAKGFYCIRFDNRDIGFSTKIVRPEPKLWKFILPACCCCCCPEKAPYTLDAMATDAEALLAHLNIPRAHVVGQSMGGMIAQVFALNYPGLAMSLTLIFTNSGNRSIKDPSLGIQMELVKKPKSEEYDDLMTYWKQFEKSCLATAKDVPEHEEREKRYCRFFKRSTYRKGMSNQGAALVTAQKRDDRLKQLNIPVVIFHGKDDLLVPVENGKHLQKCIPGSKIVLVDNMSHYIGPVQRGPLIDAIVDIANSGEAAKTQYSGNHWEQPGDNATHVQ